MKKKKNIIVLGLLLVVGIVGVTFAMFTTEHNLTNIFKTKPFSTTVYEVFESPESWTPGTTTPKEVYATNNSEIDTKVRISYTEEWTAADGSTLPIMQDDIKTTMINLANTDEWTKDGDYYYYNEILAPGETTSSFIESVTFNIETTSSFECITDDEDHDICTSTGTGYDGATYKLTFKIEIYQADMEV